MFVCHVYFQVHKPVPAPWGLVAWGSAKGRPCLLG